MGSRRFTMTHGAEGRRYWVNVTIYDTVEELRRAAVAYLPDADIDMVGCLQGNGKTTGNFLGNLRLCRDHLDPGIIVHECVHAAVVYVHKLTGKPFRLALGGSGVAAEREEDLAYAVQGMTNALLNELGLVVR